MKLRFLRGFSDFRCAAGDCPDTCCRDWAVALDPDAAQRYRALSGPLGEDLRRAMGELEGEPCLRLCGGLCPLLDEKGLCRVQLALGEDGLCESCRLHPRFAEEYGGLREWCLSLSCPEAARLLLSNPAPLCYTETMTDEPVSDCNDLNPRLFYALVSARKTAFEMVQDRSFHWEERARHLLSFAGAFQRALDQHHLSRLDDVTARFAAGRFPKRPPLALDGLLMRLGGLPSIGEEWTSMLRDALSQKPSESQRADFNALVPDYEPEHLLYYYLYRYFLKAVTDRRLLPRVRFAIFSLYCIRGLELARYCRTGQLTETDRADILHRYSRQIEHSSDNLEVLLSDSKLLFTESSTFPASSRL